MSTTEAPLPSATADPEVIIVGAGPTGLLAAVLLTRHGVRVRIFDQNPQQAHESRALAVQSRTMELFLGLRLADPMLNAGTIVTSARMFVDGSAKVELHFDGIARRDTPFPFVLTVPQRDTETILNAELERLGVKVERNVEVTAFTQSVEGVTVSARGAHGAEFEVGGAYLLGADGAHSIVRKVLGLAFEGAAYPQDFLLADCRVDGLADSHGFAIFLHGTHFAVYFPLPGAQGMGRIITMRHGGGGTHDPVEQQGGRDVALPEVEEAFREATQMDVRLRDSIWTSLYRVHHRGVDRYGVGRVFVAGDAAHIHSPAGGQGMNTGLQDSANLAWKLILALRGRAGHEALLDTYHEERWPVGQRVLEATDGMFSTMTSQSGWYAAIRNVVVPRVAGVLAHMDFARERAFNFLSQLGIHYGTDEAVLDETLGAKTALWHHSPAPGHRAGNAAFARNRDVFGLLTDYRFQVLAFSRRALSSDEIGALCTGLAALPTPPGVGLAAHAIVHCANGQDPRILRAETSEAFAAYGVDHETPEALYLIRPDGYVAWRAGSLDFDGLAAFLRERFC